MSTTTHPETQCKWCDDSFTHGYNAVYCTEECLYAQKGDGVLNMIASDHRFCSSCFKRRKNIEKPPDSFLRRRPQLLQDAIIGFEYLTPSMQQAHGLLYCECGNVDHYADHDVLKELDLAGAITNLWAILALYYEEGQFGDNRPDRDVLLESLDETGMGWCEALGRSVYGA